MVQPNEHAAPSRVLIIDDEEQIRNLCSRIVTRAGMEPHLAPDGGRGLDALGSIAPEYVLLDVNLPGKNGIEVLKEIRRRFPLTRVIMITGLHDVDLAVSAMKLGAHDYITKGDETGSFFRRLRKVLSKPAQKSFRKIVGISTAMQHIYSVIEKAAKSDSTILIQGESGTGKELVARAVHARSSRAGEPFVPVDCGAIVPSLIESELFGHVEGAYTDAKRSRPGLLRFAGGGTVFLDEIGELGAAVQAKLLRALQESEVRPVGSSGMERFDARILAATNRDLAQEVKSGNFRRDLFYRLHVVPIFVPPLRDRREDVPLLVEHFLRLHGERAGREMRISVEALRHFMHYDWPGNVRELENAIHRALALLDGEEITRSDLHLILPKAIPEATDATAHAPPATRGSLLAENEAATIANAIEAAGGNKRAAARNLGIGIATLYRKINKYKIVLPPRK